MDKIINSLAFIFILTEIIVILITYYHSIQRYGQIMKSYNNKKNFEEKNHIVIKKTNTTQPIIKSNMTQKIDTDKLEEELAYPSLVFRINGIEVETIKLCQTKTFIGRSNSDDIKIENDPTISRSQCFITNEDERYFINIHLSSNPVFLNDEEMTQSIEELFDGDIVSMGKNRKISFVFVTSSNITTPLRA